MSNLLPPPVTETIEVAPPKSKSTRRWAIGGAVALVAVVGIGTAFASGGSPKLDAAAAVGLRPQTAIEKAAATCGLFNVEDNGHSITLDTKGEEDATGDAMFSVGCVVNELSMPDYIVQKVDHTRALDGMQSDTWDGYTATWTYHPDNGLLLIIESK